MSGWGNAGLECDRSLVILVVLGGAGLAAWAFMAATDLNRDGVLSQESLGIWGPVLLGGSLAPLIYDGYKNGNR